MRPTGFTATTCVFIMGMRGCGKSFLCKTLQKIWPRRVILDPMHEYTDLNGKPIFPGAIVVRSFEEFGRELIKLEKSKNFVLIFQFDENNRNAEQEFEEICRLIYYFGNIQFVIEEVQLYSTTHLIPHWLKNLLMTGRHQGISLLFTSQRPGQINKNIFSQCEHIFCGQIIEGNDLRYISNFLNQNAKKLTNLPARKFLWRSPNGVKLISNDFKD